MYILKRILLIFIFVCTSSFGNTEIIESQLFGSELFKGNFKNNTNTYRYDENYIINVGDLISVKLWGAYELENEYEVDIQGNIYIPKIGTIYILGLKNSELNNIIKKKIKESFKDNVFVYVNLKNYQNVNIYITGEVNSPGMYQGLSTDSILQYIDKSNGITNNGSFRNVQVIRKEKIINEIDLYSFYKYGKIDNIQFKNGDVIVVKNLINKIEVLGNLNKNLIVDIGKEEKIKLQELNALIKPNVDTTHILVTNYDLSKKLYDIKENVYINNGSKVNYISEYKNKQFNIKISGEHLDFNQKIVNKGETLEQVLNNIKMSDYSNKDGIQLFRKSIAKQQKKMLDLSLDNLEKKILTSTNSESKEESMIRKEEITQVLEFIKRARLVEPKGQMIINKKSDLSKIYIEEEDEIYIPNKSNVITISGEVMFPSSQTYVDKQNIKTYIEKIGGFSEKADLEKVLIISNNGEIKTINYKKDNDYVLECGDQVMVLSKIDEKNVQNAKDIMQIIYQLAVSTSVVLRLF